VELIPAPTPATPPSVNSRHHEDVPRGLHIATAWAWRLLILAAAVAVLLWLVGRLKDVLIPLSIALLLSALLSPSVGWLRRTVRLPPSLAVAVVLIGGIAAVGGVLTLVITQFVTSFPDLAKKATEGVRTIQNQLKNGPLHLSNSQFNGVTDAAQKWVDTHRDVLTTGAVSTATTAVDAVLTSLLVLFTTFFFLRDGRRIWSFLVRLMPAGARAPLAAAGAACWATLVAYVRATILVAFIDAVGIGLALVALRVQLAFPLAALVFLCAFIPIVGATL
jgi:predicted PurR-regulated permease PerM